MAKEALTPEESDLRRRARRRLVGAIALALVAVVVLPMLFNPEPKPLGPEVDIRIPDQATPFEPGEPATPEPPPPPAAEATEAPPVAPAPPAPAAGPAQARKTAPSPAPGATPVAEEPATGPRPPQPSPPAQGSAGGPSVKPAAPPSEGFAARGYFLQLGAFTSEANARQLADKARAAGFQVAVQSVGGQVRVRVGPYQDRKEALEMQARLRAKGFGPVLLGP